MKDALICFELALTFYEEANRAVQAETWFAAAAVAAAALEAMLLAKMFVSADKVGEIASFKKSLGRHKGEFGTAAREEMNLGKPLDIAKELSWFRPGGVPAVVTALFEQHVDQDTLTALTGILNDSPSAGYVSADLLRQYRNLVHPAFCLRQAIHPIKDVGIQAAFFCVVAFAAIGSL